MTRTRTQTQGQADKLFDMETLPVSGDRFERTADELIQEEIKKRKHMYGWHNDGEAFAHLFVQYRFDLDESEASQACQIGRAGHDKGIDAYYLDEDPTSGTGTFYFVQTKSSRMTHDEQVLHQDVRRATEFLSVGSVAGMKATLGEALEVFRDAVRQRYEIICVLGLNGPSDKVRDAVVDVESELPFKCQIEVFDIDDIRALVMRTQAIPRDGPTVTFTLPTAPWELNLGGGLPTMINCVVPARELAACIRKNRLGVFSLNVREYLGSRNPVNRIVAESLRDHPERFCLLNLGIDAVCDSVRFDPVLEDLMGQKKWPMKITNFQVINGCQTAKTISDVDPDARALVMVRLIQLPRDERERVVPEISVAKNRQSPIHGRDLFAWDRSQIRLKKEFQKLGYFFETREKEWNAFSKTKADAKKLYQKGVLENTIAARSYLAVVLQDPFRSKHRKREFFAHEREGGAFERIFRDTSAEQMLLATRIYEYVSEKCQEARKRFNELEDIADQRPLKDEERFDLEEANVIWNADTFLASLMGFFIGRYYQQTLKDDRDLSLTRHMNTQISTLRGKKPLALLYDFAREITVQAYRLMRRQQKVPELYSPRRFFYTEGTYDLLREQAYAKSLHSLSEYLKPLKG